MSATTTIPSTMKSVVVRELGDASSLVLEPTYPTPVLTSGQVLVKNEYAGLNFIDTYFRKGLYAKDLPFVSGQEGGGRVVQVADDVTDLAVGDTVAYMAFGSYAGYTAVPVHKAVKVPANMDLPTAVACMVQGLTAHYLVSSAHADLIKVGEWCLIYSVGSGTCQWAARMAKLSGYKVIGTTSKTKESVAKQVGCDELIVLDTAESSSGGGGGGGIYADYESVDIAARVAEITSGEGCKCIIDGVGASTADISLNCLARRGIWISFGNASGPVPPFSLLKLSAKSAFVARPTLANYIATTAEMEGRCNDVFAWIQQGSLKITIDTVFDLEKAADGHRYLESGKSRGKILYKI